jgi:IS5 family transposase
MVGLGPSLRTRKTRHREFPEAMERDVPWDVLVQIVEPHCRKVRTGRPPIGIQSLLRIHGLQQWFGWSEPAMDEALHDVPLYREFVWLDGASARLPDKATLPWFHHLPEPHGGRMLWACTAVGATLIPAPSSIDNAAGERDPETNQTKKANKRHFGTKAHIGVDAAPGLVPTVDGAAASLSDLNAAGQQPHRAEHAVFGDAGYRAVRQRPQAVALPPSATMRRPSTKRP